MSGSLKTSHLASGGGLDQRLSDEAFVAALADVCGGRRANRISAVYAAPYKIEFAFSDGLLTYIQIEPCSTNPLSPAQGRLAFQDDLALFAQPLPDAAAQNEEFAVRSGRLNIHYNGRTVCALFYLPTRTQP